jgi:hypothetical protein
LAVIGKTYEKAAKGLEEKYFMKLETIYHKMLATIQHTSQCHPHEEKSHRIYIFVLNMALCF